MSSRTRMFRRNATIGVASLAIAATIMTAAPAQADPPLTLTEAKAQVVQLETEAAAIDQQYAGVQEKLESGKAVLATRDLDVEKQAAKVSRMKAQVGQVALAQFQNRNIDTTAQLFFTEDTTDFLNQISTVEKHSKNQNTVLQQFQREQAELAQLERSAENDLADLKAHKKKLKELRKASDNKVEEAEAVLGRLTEVERKRLEAEEAAQAAKAQQAAGGAANTSEQEESGQEETAADPADGRSSDTSRTADRPSRNGEKAEASSTGSSKGETALAYARKQLGKPYSFGATGPGSFDCSGLTGSAWRTAGVSLSRVSQDQFNNGTAVDKSDLQPGDLVFFYSDLSHVGLYAGNGTIIHASRPGKPVEYMKMSYMPYIGARRPG